MILEKKLMMLNNENGKNVELSGDLSKFKGGYLPVFGATFRAGRGFELDGKTYKDTSNLDEAECPTCHSSPCKCEDMEEGNAFGAAVAKAKADGIQPGETVKVGGKEYPVKEEEQIGLEEYWKSTSQTLLKMNERVRRIQKEIK